MLGYRFTVVPAHLPLSHHRPNDRLHGDPLLDDQLPGENNTVVSGDLLPSGNSSPALEYPNNRLAQLSSCESMRSVTVAFHQDPAFYPLMPYF